MIEKNYQPADIESRMSRIWEESGAFKAGRPERRDSAPFTIVIPPPNVTGSLHMGHALNNTLQDILCRFERMRGRDVLWQPGTDHAGIATQMVVERQLMERQEPARRDIGRAKFLERVWQWKAESGGVIVNQLKRLGASCDWSRERFTMDEGLSRAVVKVFVELHREGLIYKDKRLVNWDPKLLTAISDLEVQQVEHRGSFVWSRDSGESLDCVALEKTLNRDPNGHLYYIDYPLFAQNESAWVETGEFITVATTRPETMLGDVAVAVHPESELWRRHQGKRARLPLVLNHPIYSNLIPIIADEYADPEKGTGAVKVTPAHDFNDYDVWLRHSNKGQELENVQPIDIFTPEATLKSSPKEDFASTKSADWPNAPQRASSQRETALDTALGGLSIADLIPESLRGKPRFEVRRLVVEMLADQNLSLLVKIEPHTHMVPHGDRSGDVIEPYLTDQWYVDAKTLAEPAIAAVRNGATSFVPKNWEKTYFEWMENIQPWCISRQLWWGHRIPAWYGPEGLPFVAETEADAINLAIAHYEHKGMHQPGLFDLDGADYAAGLREGRYKLSEQDEDVLDTWFSSALWPFSTLGWPDDKKDVERYYPTDVLVTGFDIIFFWVARMMMMGIHFMQKEQPAAPIEKVVPFPTVYIHALVRDAKGAKMSKSKGNVIDPLHLIDDYGADALRFTLAAMAAQGRDIKLDTQRVAGYRSFATKLWNACRFAEINGCLSDWVFDPASCTDALNRGMIRKTARAAREVTESIDAYRFNDAADAVYRLVWDEFCDWYIEFAKQKFNSSDDSVRQETRATTKWVLDQLLKLLHPFMPFITEELWSSIGKRSSVLTLAAWPALTKFEEMSDEVEIDFAFDVVKQVRSARASFKIPAQEPIVTLPENLPAANNTILESNAESISRLANTELVISRFASVPSISDTFVYRMPISGYPSATLSISMPPSFNRNEQIRRLNDELRKIQKEIDRFDAKFANKEFMAKAPEDIVVEQRAKRGEFVEQQATIIEALEQLKDAS